MNNHVAFIKYCLINVVVVFAVSCNSSHTKEINDMPGTIIDLKAISDKKIGDLVCDFEYILLEETDESLIGDLSVIDMIGDTIYACDYHRNTAYMFHRDGRFIRGIGQKGRGPNEYLGISSFILDHKNKKIIITDSVTSKLFIFDSSGELELVINAGKTIYRINKLGNNYVHINDGNETDLIEQMRKYNISILDNELNVIDNIFPDKTPNPILAYSSTKAEENGKLLYMPMLSNSIYELSEDSITTLYSLRYSTSKLKMITPDEQQKIYYQINDSKSNLEDYENSGYACTYGYFIDGKDLLYIMIGFDKHYAVYYFKDSGQSLAIDYSKPKSYVLETLPQKEIENMILNGTPLYIENDRVYVTLNYYKISRLGSFLESGTLKNICDAASDNSNPIILSFRFKDSIFEGIN